MRDIPQSLLDKIKSAYQTSNNNSNPSMDIIVQQTNQFLSDGLMLNPFTIRTGEVLGPLDIAVRREDANSAPQELVMVYIEGGQAKIATLNITDHVGKGWVYQYTIGPAIDCAIDFDGRWRKITSLDDTYFFATSRWALVTFGEPYISLVKSDGSLTVQIGQEAPVSLAPDGVTKCSMIRGWKNTQIHNNDQGIIVAYIRGGHVYYRNYALQPPDQPATWEPPRQVTEFDTSVNPASHISVFRTNDYRVGFLAEINGQMFWALSGRNWSGMAIEDHEISVGLTDYTIQVLPIQFHDAYETEHISAGITDYFIAQCSPITPTLLSIENSDAFTITLTFSHNITQSLTGRQALFTVRDSASTPNQFAVLSTSAGVSQAKLVLTLGNFSSATGNMVVTYNNGVTGDNLIPHLSCKNALGDVCEFAIESFSTSFAPDLAPPEGYNTHTVSAGLTEYTITVSAINYRNGFDSDHLSTGLTNYTITVTKVGENPL